MMTRAHLPESMKRQRWLTKEDALEGGLCKAGTHNEVAIVVDNNSLTGALEQRQELAAPRHSILHASSTKRIRSGAP